MPLEDGNDPIAQSVDVTFRLAIIARLAGRVLEFV
jgi:hypothetical protein